MPNEIQLYFCARCSPEGDSIGPGGGGGGGGSVAVNSLDHTYNIH